MPTKRTTRRHEREPNPIPPLFGVRCRRSGGRAGGGHGEEPFTMHILKTRPDVDRKAIRSKRNQYWNGLRRDDEELLA